MHLLWSPSISSSKRNGKCLLISSNVVNQLKSQARRLGRGPLIGNTTPPQLKVLLFSALKVLLLFVSPTPTLHIFWFFNQALALAPPPQILIMLRFCILRFRDKISHPKHTRFTHVYFWVWNSIKKNRGFHYFQGNQIRLHTLTG